MMKRTLSMFLVLVLALGMLPVTASAVCDGMNILDGPRPYATYYESEYNDTTATADKINADGAFIYGEVGSDAAGDYIDYLKFTIDSSHELWIDAVSGAGGEKSTSFSLCDANGNLIKMADYYGLTDSYDDEFMLWKKLSAGTYYIRIKDFTNWVEYSIFTSLTPLLESPKFTITNRNTDGKPVISWKEIPGAKSYDVYRSTGNGGYACYGSVTGTSFCDTRAKAGNTYEYYVCAISGDSAYGDSMAYKIISWTCALPRPTNVKDTRNSSTGKVTISWDPVEGADKYSVYYSTDGSSYKLLKTITGTSLTHSSATLGTTYYYKVKAVYSANTAANSAYSSWVKGTATNPAPTVTLSNVASTGKIKITWTKVSGAKSYDVYRSTDGSNWTLLKNTTGTSLTNTSVTAGTTYYYKVKAVGTASDFSTVKSCTCDLPAPTLTVSTNSSDKPKLSWNAVSGAKQYKVAYSTDNVNWSVLKTMTGTSLTHSSATAGTTYYYKVMAVSSVSAANSAYSSVKSLVVPNVQPLSAPTLTVSTNSSGKPKLSWNAVSGAKQYKVAYSTDNVNWSVLKTMTGTSLTHSSAQAGTTYYYKVMAVSSNTAANSAYSSVGSLTVSDAYALAAPTLSVTLSNGKPKLSWTQVNGATEYKIYWSENGGNTWVMISSDSTGDWMIHLSASKGVTHYYKIVAVSPYDTSDYSNVVSIVPTA